MPATEDGRNLEYELVFHSAASLLFALRIEPFNLDYVLWMLMKLGIEFNTARVFTHDHLRTPQMAPEFSLKEYKADHEFTSDDYI